MYLPTNSGLFSFFDCTQMCAASLVQGVSTQTFIFHFALAGRNMQDSFGLEVIWES